MPRRTFAWHRHALAWLVCVAAIAMAHAAAATADLPQLPTEALRAYYGEKRAGGAERSQALCNALLYLAERRDDRAQRIELLAQASSMDPTRVEPHLRRAQALALQRDLGGAVLALREAVAALPLDPVETAHLLYLGQRTAHGVWLTALWVCVGVLALRSLPFVRHRFTARGAHAVPLTLLVVAPIAGLAIAAPTWATLLAAVALTPILRRSERGVLAALCLLAGSADLALNRLAPEAILLDPGSTSAVLARANFGSADPNLVATIESTLGESPERELVLGLQAARARHWDAAQRHYTAAVQADPTWSPAYVDLANIFFKMGDHQRAASGYRTALSYAPESAYAHANLAQTYIAMLQFDVADQEMHAATALAFETASRQRAAWERQDAAVFDVLLPAEDVRFVARAEADARPERVQALLQTWRGHGWEHLPRSVAPWAFLATALVLLVPWRLTRLAHACGSCGRMCCPHCFSTDDEPSSQCVVCITADPTRPKRARLLRRRSVDDAPVWAVSYIASLFPGAADLVRGRPLMALPAVVLASIALLGLQGALDAVLADPFNVMVLGSNTVRLAMIVFYAAYLPGLLQLRRDLAHRPAFRGSGA